MHLATIRTPKGQAAVVLVGEDVLALAGAQAKLSLGGGTMDTMREVLSGGDATLDLIRKLAAEVAGDAALADRLRKSGLLIRVADITFLAPVPDPNMILSCGANSRAHCEEMGTAPPERPVGFIKNNGAITGPGSDIVLPKGRDQKVDWEIEFSGVIGRTCHQVSPQEALDYVAGYTLIIDVSARDWVAHFPSLQGFAAIDAMDTNLLGKQFPTFCPMGPVIATKDEVPDPERATYELRVNGVPKQTACTDDLVFSLAKLISYYSQWYRFEPGDIITTGSPPGVGFGRKPPEFLKAGDVVTIEAAGIGTMSNTIVAAS